MFLIKLFLIVCLARADSFALPEEPFVDEYNKATSIAMGEIVEITEAKIEVPEFGEFEKKDIKKIKLKLVKVWKGDKQKAIEFYCAFPKKSTEDLARESKTFGFLWKGLKILVFLRGDEIKVAQYRFGIGHSNNIENLKKRDTYKALEAIASGKSVEEAAKFIDR